MTSCGDNINNNCPEIVPTRETTTKIDKTFLAFSSVAVDLNEWMNEYIIHQHRYNTVKPVKSRTVSTGQKGSKSTYNCAKRYVNEETHRAKTKHYFLNGSNAAASVAPTLIRHWPLQVRDGTGSRFVTQRPSDPGIQRPRDPVDPVTLFYNELQMSTYVWRSILRPKNF